MHFDLNEEQQILKDSVGRLLSDSYEFEDRTRYAASDVGWSRDMWSRYAEFGLLGLPFDEDYGGFSGSPVETMIIMEAFGRALVLEPYLATVVLGGAFLQRGGSETQRAAYLPRIAEGSLRLAFAHTERQSRYDLAHVMTTARRDGGSWILDGEKTVVLHGDSADHLVVSARTAGETRDRPGIGLFLVDANADGVSRSPYPTQDGQRAASVTLTSVHLAEDAAIGKPGDALPLIEEVTDGAIAALCAEAVGIMDDLHSLTVEYLKTRHQFGVPIGDFQVLKHRAVDMFMMLEQARSMAMLATIMVQNEDPLERRKAVSAAKVQIANSARFLGQQAIQLHGGIGMTMEYKAGHSFKRLTMIESLLGDADHHLGLLADVGGPLDN